MPRIPVRIQGGVYGTQNPASPSNANRPAVTIRQTGPVQPREQFDDRQLNAIQRSVEQATAVAKANPMANGNLIENLPLKSGDNVVAHGLGASFRSAIVHGCDTSGVSFAVKRNSDARLDARQLVISASAPCVVFVWVY